MQANGINSVGGMSNEHEDSEEGTLGSDSNQLFELEKFFPYQTRVFYRQISSAVSHVYESRYNLKPYEWRTMAILGIHNEFTANEIVERSSMDKVSASRALASLKKRGWILLRQNKNDGRSRLIKLSAAGKSVYLDLVPHMLAMEKELLSVLTEDEATELRRLMRKMTTNVQP